MTDEYKPFEGWHAELPGVLLTVSSRYPRRPRARRGTISIRVNVAAGGRVYERRVYACRWWRVGHRVLAAGRRDRRRRIGAGKLADAA